MFNYTPHSTRKFYWKSIESVKYVKCFYVPIQSWIAWLGYSKYSFISSDCTTLWLGLHLVTRFTSVTTFTSAERALICRAWLTYFIFRMYDWAPVCPKANFNFEPCVSGGMTGFDVTGFTAFCVTRLTTVNRCYY